ncbi:MAG: heme exporter protein CcmD [Gammaproteobacteria bacterium]|nr:heme exporter protein CcmD [Gammaproteobacteria bacterium]
MNSAEFFHMGGYALYVWGSYGITFVVLTLNVVLALGYEREVLRGLLRTAQRNRSRA